MDKILVVNVNWLGDVIFSSAVFKALKEAYPTAKISCLAVPRVKEVLECIPDIDEIIIYDEDGQHKNPLAKLALIGELRRHKFDSAFLLHRSLTRALLVFLAGIPIRVGSDTKGRGRFLTQPIKPLEKNVHRCDEYLHVIESYGINVRDRKTHLTVLESAQQEVKNILKKYSIGSDEFLIVIHPSGNWDLKRWPKENFTKLIDHLMTAKSSRIVVTGSSADMILVKEMIEPLNQKPIILTGQTDLKQLMALIKRANLLISADSGPLHLASSIGTRTIGLFGPTRPEITGPRGEGKSFLIAKDVGCNREACYHLQCPDNICMQSITVMDVIDGIRQVQNS